MDQRKVTCNLEAGNVDKSQVAYRQTEHGKAARNRAVKKWQATHRAECNKYNLILQRSKAHLKKVFPVNLKSKGLTIHHAFGEFADRFIVMPTSLHKDMHKKFGRRNEDCLWFNKDVAAYLMEAHRHFWIITGNTIRTERTFRNTYKEYLF